MFLLIPLNFETNLLRLVAIMCVEIIEEFIIAICHDT